RRAPQIDPENTTSRSFLSKFLQENRIGGYETAPFWTESLVTRSETITTPWPAKLV
ncbi:hypothetical protein FRC20_007887, partial [Serendipita sp. 405]